MDNTALEQEFRQLIDTVYSPEAMDDNHSLDLAIQFISDHEGFVKQDRRYTEFEGLVQLLHPASDAKYYLLVDALMGFAKTTNDAKALTDICKRLELLYAPANVAIVKDAISTLLDCKAYRNASELCERLEATKQIRDKYKPHINSAL